MHDREQHRENDRQHDDPAAARRIHCCDPSRIGGSPSPTDSSADAPVPVDAVCASGATSLTVAFASNTSSTCRLRSSAAGARATTWPYVFVGSTTTDVTSATG